MHEGKCKRSCVQELTRCIAVYGPSIFGTDISFLIINDTRMANIYLTPNYTIALGITDAYNGTSLRDHQPVSPTILQYPFFSATSLSSNSSLIYVYHQVNETFMGEMTYDTAKNAWASEPVHIPFFQNGTSIAKL